MAEVASAASAAAAAAAAAAAVVTEAGAFSTSAAVKMFD